MTLAIITGAVALLLSLVLTPVARRLSLAVGMTDAPGGRRIHLRPIPRGGGVAVAMAAVVACAVYAGLPTGVSTFALGGGALLLVVGLADDLLSLRPHTKLLGQVLAAVLAVAGGLRLSLFDSTGVGGVFALLDPALTVMWVVLITNAVNLTDGLDGLAAGVGVIACAWLACAALVGAEPGAAIAPLALAGALLGFLAYNFNPATIFLGDAGSLVIGYAMAVLPLVGTGGRGMPLVAAALLVAFPVTDTMLAIARRFVSRCVRLWGDGFFWRGLIEGLRSTLLPDRGHIHHRLLDLGFSQRRTVLLIYLASATTGALSYVMARSPGWPVDLFAVGLAIGVIAIVQALGIGELQLVRSGLFLPLVRRLAPQRWLITAVDAWLVGAVYGGALLLVGGRPADLRAAAISGASALAFMASLQLVTFHALGVYRTAWRAAGVGGFGLLIRACAAGTVSGYVILRLLGLPTGVAVAVVHFFFLLSAVTLVRFSYVLLLRGALGTAEAEPALVCGTGEWARYALGRLRRVGPPSLRPVGFIELRPRWQGRQLDRLPVLGTLDALPIIVEEQRVRHLVIADPALRGDALAWVQAVCRQLGVRVHRYMEKFVSHCEAVDQLCGVKDVATAWAVLGKVFGEMGLDGCVLSVAGSGSNGANGGRREVYTWRRIADAGPSGSGSLSAFLHEGLDGGPDRVPHLKANGTVKGNAAANGNGKVNAPGAVNGNGSVNGNGRAKARAPLNGDGPVNGNGLTVLRREGDRWCPVELTAPRAEDVLALPIKCGEAVWGVLLATPQAGNRLITPAERLRLQRAAEALGQRVAQWNSHGNGQAPVEGSSAPQVQTARTED